MIVDCPYKLGDILYLKTDIQQYPRLVTAIIITKGDILIELSCSTIVSKHYLFEVTEEINVLIQTSN